MRAAAGLLLLGAAGVLLTVSLFFGGGSGDGWLFWIGAGALLVALAAVGAALAGAFPWPEPGRAGLAALGLLAAFVLWNGLTMSWSIAPDRSWSYLDRGLVYLAFAVVGLFAAAICPRPVRIVAGGLAALLGGVLLWALAGKVVPALFPDGARVARLRNPVGYWNSLALAADLALPLFLWLSARRRDLAALGLYVAVVALLLTYSRAGVAVGIIAVALWLWAGRARSESLRALLVAVPAALAVAGIALALPGVSDDLQPHSVRVQDGALFGVVLLVGMAVVAVLARRDLRQAEERALAVAAVLIVAAGVGALAARGGWLEEFRDSDAAQVTQSSNRLTTVSSNNRWSWWREAWSLFEQAPAGGKGAHTFEIARTKLRRSAVVTTEPHNVALQALAETGVAGFLLGAGATLAALVAAAGAVRRLRGGERAAAVALAIADRKSVV